MIITSEQKKDSSFRNGSTTELLIQEIEELERTALKLEPALSERVNITKKAVDYVNQFIESLPKSKAFENGEKETSSTKNYSIYYMMMVDVSSHPQ